MRIRGCFILFVILILFPFSVKANSISNIDSKVFIDSSGKATITEVWSVLVDEGTEGYHPFSNLGDMKISLIGVSMDDKDYTIVSNWNINDNINNKAYKAGINISGDEYSICFGLSEMGRHIYKIVYSIDNFVINLSDSQMIYFNFFSNNDIDIANVNIQIYSDNKYSNNVGVYGFGKSGAPAYLKDGRIFMSTNNKELGIGEYMTLLVRFPSNTFNANYNINNKFDYYLKKANKGAVAYSDDVLEIPLLMILILLFIPIAIVLLLFGKIFGNNHTQGNNSYKLNNLNVNNNLGDVLPYRGIPFNGDMIKTYWVIYNYNLGTRDENILGAYLLKWINNDNIELEKVGNKIKNILFVNKPVNCSSYEEQLYVYFRLASITNDKLDDINNIVYKLDKNEFSEWCSVNGYRVREWFNKVLEYVTDEFVKEGKVKANVKNNIVKYDVNDSIVDDVKQVIGLKKFLEDFTIVDEREFMEVKLLNDYLIYASMFGISKQVFKKLKDFYPNLIVEDLINYDVVDFVSDLVSTDISFTTNNNNSNNNSFGDMVSDASSYGSTGVGGSGFSSSGGGKDAFGGGNSGIGFR